VNEQLLAEFLKGKASAAELGQAFLTAQVSPEAPTFRRTGNYRVTPLQKTVEVTGADVERLVMAVEAGQLSEEEVGIAVFLLESGGTPIRRTVGGSLMFCSGWVCPWSTIR
jgi:hypothetical protein